MIMGLLSVACTDFLDVRPENSTTFNNYFRSGKDAEALLNSMMSNLRFAENQDQVHAWAGMKACPAIGSANLFSGELAIVLCRHP